MGDDLNVTHGGVVAVDTTQLWIAAASIAHHARKLSQVLGEVEWSQGALRSVEHLLDADVLEHARRAVWSAQTLRMSLGELGGSLGRTAEAYEEVELRARWQLAQLQCDVEAQAEILVRAAALHIDVASLDDEQSRFGEGAAAWWEMALQYAFPMLGLGPFGGAGAVGAAAMLLAIGGTIDLLGRGTIPAGTALIGPAQAVTLKPVPPPAGSAAAAGSLAGSLAGSPAGSAVASARTVAPPSSLAALAKRIPTGAAQLSIERFKMPGGRTEWAVYVAGTKSSAIGGAEPWDMKSNTELYLGNRSASSEAVAQALRAAGVRPGDPLHLVGHSQGGMIAANVAVSGEFEVASLTTFGSPVDAEVSDSVLSVRVRHDDDPVAALAGRGSAAGAGSPDSVVVTRTGDPAPGLHDLGLPMHSLDAYAVTAERYQASGDSRVAAVDRLFEHLGTAEAVSRTDYVAARSR